MKKLLLLMAIALQYSSFAYADDDDWDDRGYYVPPPVYNYYPPPPIYNYYAPPPVTYYPPPPPYYGSYQNYSIGLPGVVLNDILGLIHRPHYHAYSYARHHRRRHHD